MFSWDTDVNRGSSITRAHIGQFGIGKASKKKEKKNKKGTPNVVWTILNRVPRNGEDQGIWAAMNLLTVRAVAERVVVDPIGFVIDEGPAILGTDVAQSVIVERKRPLPLSMTIGKGLFVFLLAAVDIGVEEPVARGEPNHETHCHGGHPPVVVRGDIADERVQHVLIEVVRNCGICLVLQKHRVTLAKGER